MKNSFEIKEVLFSEQSSGGPALGIIELNRPQAINALNFSLVSKIGERASEWENAPGVSAVLLKGIGPKGFCAGGDVKAVVKSLLNGDSDLAAKFFEKEYDTDLLLHEYKKPTICFGDGLVIGGGMGLMQACSHRIVTERSLLAMPELAIGFFPDVGAGWFLNQLAPGVGVFLALTGWRLSGFEAIEIGLADSLCRSKDLYSVQSQLIRCPWTTASQKNRKMVDEIFSYYSNSPRSNESQKSEFYRFIKSELFSEVFTQKDFSAMVDKFGKMAKKEDLPHSEIWKKAWQQFQTGSPLSAKITWEYLLRTRNLSRAQVKDVDLKLAMNLCHKKSDFSEGVRALLIDKDKTPKWQIENFRDVADIETHEFFT